VYESDQVDNQGERVLKHRAERWVEVAEDSVQL
jgi:hypothetical protein